MRDGYARHHDLRALAAVLLSWGFACGTGDASSPSPSPSPVSDSDSDAGASVIDASPPLDAGPRAVLHVLFIGNSYTYVNDVPGLLSRIAETSPAGPRIEVDSVVKGGATLEDHVNDGIAQRRIAERKWSHVVLQGQSIEPTTPNYFLPAAKTLADLATAAGARTTWYVTWARAPEDAAYRSAYTSPDELQDRLTSAYDEAARRSPGSLLACVGEAFRSSLAAHPEIRQHQDDGSHASVAGSYLAASTIYVALTGSSVAESAALPDGLDASQAKSLRAAANVGAKCTDVTIKAAVHFDASPYDFGTAGTPLPLVLSLTNRGNLPTTLTDGHTLAAPFAWTSGAFPSGTCSSTLAPGETCSVSVTFTGKADGASSVTILTSDAYQPSVSRTLAGKATDRALLTISEWTNDACLQCPTLYLSGSDTFTFVVTNRGARPTTSMGPGEPLASPLSWDGAGFPGGAGSDVPSFPPAVTLPFCGPTLAPGAQCLVRVHIDRPDAGGSGGGQLPAFDAGPPQDRSVSVAYADDEGAITTFASRAVQLR